MVVTERTTRRRPIRVPFTASSPVLTAEFYHAGMPPRTGDRPRCAWAQSELAIRYHDDEWGTPTHDDRTLFEFLILEGAQAGLSWETILRKRERYREVFDGFDPERGPVSRAQRGRILKAARAFLRRYGVSDRPARFDLVTVRPDPSGRSTGLFRRRPA